MAHLTPGIIILKKNVSALTTHMGMLSHKFQPPGQMVLENIFKDFYYLSLCKNSTPPPILAPSYPRKYWFKINLNIHYLYRSSSARWSEVERKKIKIASLNYLGFHQKRTVSWDGSHEFHTMFFAFLTPSTYIRTKFYIRLFVSVKRLAMFRS